MTEGRDRIIARAAQEIQDGMVVNLGIGMPTLLAALGSEREGVMFHSENGLLGIGPYPTADEVDADLVNASRETVTAVPGAAFFDTGEAFAMARGGHIDLAILGGLQVSASGDLANWTVPGKMIKGVGGAMDIVVGAKRLVVLMEHLTKSGESRLRRECTFPLTGVGVVDRVITDLAVFDFVGPDREIVLVEQLTDMSLPDLIDCTEAIERPAAAA